MGNCNCIDKSNPEKIVILSEGNNGILCSDGNQKGLAIGERKSQRGVANPKQRHPQRLGSDVKQPFL
jgi:hypothetical protein